MNDCECRIPIASVTECLNLCEDRTDVQCAEGLHRKIKILQWNESPARSCYDSLLNFCDRTRFVHLPHQLVPSETQTCFQASPIRIATCNLHGHLVKSGVTGVLPAVQVRQFVAAGSNVGVGNTSSFNTTGSGRSQHAASR